MLSRISRLRRRGGISLFDIFVSSLTGNDANDGLSKLTPKKTITAAFATGKKRIGLKPGDVFNEAATIAPTTSGYVFKPWGAGFAEIDNSIDLTGWTKTPGYTNLYETSFASISQETGCAVYNIIKYDLSRIANEPFSCMGYIPIATSIDNCEATENTMWTLSQTGAITKIYIHITGGVNPTTTNFKYKIPNVKTIFKTNDYGTNGKQRYENLILKPAIYSSPSTLGNSIIKNIFAICCNSWHYWIAAGGQWSNVIFCNSSKKEDIAVVNYQGSGGIGGYELEFKNSLFIDVIKGYYSHAGTGTYIKKSDIHNIFFWASSQAVTIGKSDIGITHSVRNIYVDGGAKLYSLNQCVDIQDCVVMNCEASAINPVGDTYNTLPFYGKNIIANTKNYMFNSAVTVPGTLEHCIGHIKNTTSISAGAITKGLINYRYNIIIMDCPNSVANSSDSRLYLTPYYSNPSDVAAYSQIIDYNVYILAAGNPANVRWGYSLWDSFDTWKTNSGKDAHSIYLDLTSKGGFSYLFNADYTMKDVPEKAQILAVGAGLTKTFRGFPVKPTYEQAHQMQIDGTLDYYTRDLFY